MSIKNKFQLPKAIDSDDEDSIPAASHFKAGRILPSLRDDGKVKSREAQLFHDPPTNDSATTKSAVDTAQSSEPNGTQSTLRDVASSAVGQSSSNSQETTSSEPIIKGPNINRPVRSGPTNAIIVNPKQRGNPILKHITNVAWEYGDIVADYQVGLTSCALFLSLRYHNLNPDYIQNRLNALRNMYELRVLLVQVDIKDPHYALKELALMSILANCTLMVAWSPEEAGRYLETYKVYENKPPDAIMARPERDLAGQVADALTTVKGVNKTDAATLMASFDSLASLIEAPEERLLLCPGLGPLKAKRLHDLFNTPFTKWK